LINRKLLIFKNIILIINIMNNIFMLDKYKPKNSSDLKGNDINIKFIKKWLNIFKNNDNNDLNNFKNGLLITGDSGIGKTLTAQLLLKEENFDIIEFNASELRSAKIIREKFKSLINGSNILKMVNNTNKIGILMDEIDSNSIDKGCLKEIISYIENDLEYITNDTKKKNKEIHINKYPIICICNSLSSTIKTLNKACISINFQSPNQKIILEFINKIFQQEFINLDLKSKNLLITYSQNDYRRILYILDNIVSYFKKKKISFQDINSVINTFAQKDLDISLYDNLNKIFNEKMTVNEILHIYNYDKTFIPLLIHENFNRNLEYNKIETNKNKIKRMINYYNNVIEGINIESSLHENNNWELTEYVGIFSCVSANYELNNNIFNTKTNKYTDIDSSPVFSKINYKFYNLKLINSICKKLDIKTSNFQDFTFSLYKYFIFNKISYNKDFKEFIHYLKKKINFTEFDKIIKLSYLYEQYKNTYTAKKKKELEIIFTQDFK